MRRLLVCTGTLIALVFSASAGFSEPKALAPPEADVTDFDALLENGTSLFSQGREELLIRYFFKDKRKGVYLDIGCYLPHKFSTTHYLEEKLNWRGIGVDATKGYGPAWRKHRPHSKFFAYAITDRSGDTLTFHEAGPISSLDRSNIDKWEEVSGRDFGNKEVQVPTITMNDLLDREGVKKIDFLSIDINGTEPAAMAGFDIKRFRPELVHIEVHKGNQKVLAEYFEKNGYRRIDEYLKYDFTNWYYTPKEDAGAQKKQSESAEGR